MMEADQVFGAVIAYLLIGGLTAAGLILLGVFTFRTITRSRRRPR